MRTLAFMPLTAGVLATASLPASAAQIVETFTISVSGAPDQNFLSTPFDLFHPSLGTLTSVGESVSGSLTWTPGASDQELLLVLGKTGTSQFFSGSEFGRGSGRQRQPDWRRRLPGPGVHRNGNDTGEPCRLAEPGGRDAVGRQSHGPSYLYLHACSRSRTLDLGNDAAWLRRPWLRLRQTQARASLRPGIAAEVRAAGFRASGRSRMGRDDRGGSLRTNALPFREIRTAKRS